MQSIKSISAPALTEDQHLLLGPRGVVSTGHIRACCSLLFGANSTLEHQMGSGRIYWTSQTLTEIIAMGRGKEK